MSVIVAKDLCRTYGSRRGISDVNLTINAGEIFGFLGPNGAGKSTAIRVLMGLLRASSGTARIFGKDCWREGSTIRRDIGYVAGDVRLYSWLTTRRGLRMISKIHGRDLLPNGLRLAERFRLEPDLVIRKMSRGNRQKVALVLALAHAPQLVILDEPTSGLDPLMQDTLMMCLRELAREGRTVMFSRFATARLESSGPAPNCGHIAGAATGVRYSMAEWRGCEIRAEFISGAGCINDRFNRAASASPPNLCSRTVGHIDTIHAVGGRAALC